MQCVEVRLLEMLAFSPSRLHVSILWCYMHLQNSLVEQLSPMQFRVGTADSSGFLGISASRIFMYGAHILVGEGSVRKERAPEALFSVCPIFSPRCVAAQLAVIMQDLRSTTNGR